MARMFVEFTLDRDIALDSRGRPRKLYTYYGLSESYDMEYIKQGLKNIGDALGISFKEPKLLSLN